MHKISVNGKSFCVEVLSVKGKSVLFEIAGKRYLVEHTVLSTTTDTVHKTPRSTLASTTPGVDSIRSEIPGLVHSILKNKGDEILAGETILIIEAMKMQNRIVAHKDGTIEDIYVEVGQEVTKGQSLLKIQ